MDKIKENYEYNYAEDIVTLSAQSQMFISWAGEEDTGIPAWV